MSSLRMRQNVVIKLRRIVYVYNYVHSKGVKTQKYQGLDLYLN